MTNAINTLTGLIGKERAEFFRGYLNNGYTLTVYTLDGEFAIEDERGSVLESSFETGKDVQAAAGRWNVTNAVGHMEQNGEKMELTADEIDETPEVEEGDEVEVVSAIDTAAELIAEGMSVEDAVSEITAIKGIDLGRQVHEHFRYL
jgi:hypothetical protein